MAEKALKSYAQTAASSSWQDWRIEALSGEPSLLSNARRGSLNEMAQASATSKKEVGRHYRFLLKKLPYSVRPLKAEEYVTRLCNELALHGKVEEAAHKILKAVRS